MPNPTEPRLLENTPVQLARMEGVLNLVADRVSGLITRVDRHEGEIGTLKSLTQSLKEGAKASTEKAEALALALKEAKEAVGGCTGKCHPCGAGLVPDHQVVRDSHSRPGRGQHLPSSDGKLT